MHSLTQRLLWAATAVLGLFLGGMGLIIDAAIRDSLAESIRERLQAQVYALLAAADIDDEGRLMMPAQLPDARFNRPDSGLYAQITGPGFQWRSPSTMGENPRLPADPLAPGVTEFLPLSDIGPERAFVFRQGIAWETDDGERRFVLAVAEHRRTYEAQLAEFRKTLWIWIGAGALLLLAIQLLILRWGIRPVRDLAGELDAIKRGEEEQIRGRYPRELQSLTTSLNAFIRSERENLSRYRNRLSDLAHGLKTPLAVLRATLEGREETEAVAHVDRMDELVAYQLKRARTSGHLTLGQPVPVAPQAEAVVASLEKVYADREVVCGFEIEPGTAFYGESGDLLELLGNLLDNAFKYCRNEVLLSAAPVQAESALRPGLRISVADDGPGIPADQVERVMRRGERGDERIPGHGIGLAIVADVVDLYRGRIDIREGALGGAEVSVEFPAR